MNIRTFLALPALAISLQAAAINVTIIESLTGNPWAIQDSIWKDVAVAMGYSVTIVPQSTLDDLANLNGTDVLVVSSGTISFAGTNHLLTIAQYVLSGRPAYIQSEYLVSYQGNITFDSLMTALSADFAWSFTVNGSLIPMNVTGDLATTPNAVPTLSYFNYGCAGGGIGVETFLTYSGEEFGFYRDGGFDSGGTVITISDEDWAWNNASPELMENILYKLATSSNAVQEPMAHGAFSIFPNPFAHQVAFTLDADGPCELVLRDVSGREVIRRSFTRMLTVNAEGLVAGVYTYEVLAGGSIVKKGKAMKE